MDKWDAFRTGNIFNMTIHDLQPGPSLWETLQDLCNFESKVVDKSPGQAETVDDSNLLEHIRSMKEFFMLYMDKAESVEERAAVLAAYQSITKENMEQIALRFHATLKQYPESVWVTRGLDIIKEVGLGYFGGKK